MPKLSCACGEVINLSSDPNPHGFRLLPEITEDPLVEALMASHRGASSDTDFERSIYAAFRDPAVAVFHVYECPHCRRLAVFRRASDRKVLQWYQPEGLGSSPVTLASLVPTGDEPRGDDQN